MGFVCINCAQTLKKQNSGWLSSAAFLVVFPAKHIFYPLKKMSFYLAIPSDSSHKFFPGNKTSSYTTKLAKEIILHDDYEIGLSSIHFPLTYYNVSENEFKVFKVKETTSFTENNVAQSMKLFEFDSMPEGRYPPETMVEEMFKRIPKKFVDVSVSSYNRRIKLKIGDELNLSFNPALMEFMGGSFDPQPLDGYIFRKNTTYSGLRVIDYQRACHNLYVYCDLVEPRTVGDTQVSLLATLANPSGGSFGDTVVKRFDTIRYFKLGKNRFDTVKIDIVSD